MITLLAPTKTQSPCSLKNHSNLVKPNTLEKANALMQLLKKLTLTELAALLKVSEKIAVKTKKSIDEWGQDLTPALFLFQGDAFQKLDADSLSADELLFSQDHLIILSALYGYLRPLDCISPYRLDMKEALEIPHFKNLYHYWKETITNDLNKSLSQQKTRVVLNLASDEYFDVIDHKKIEADIVHTEFKVHKDNTYKTVGVYAKRGRGLLARHIIKNKIDDPSEIVTFDAEGFKFSKKLSTHNKTVFVLTTRENP